MNHINRLIISLVLILTLLLGGCSSVPKELEPVVPESERPQISRSNLKESKIYERAFEDSTLVLAVSDFQDPRGKEEINCTERMETIIGNMNLEPKFDGFLFCGDVDCNTYLDTAETIKGHKELNDFISDYIKDDDKIYVKGNHDVPESSLITPSGSNDAKEYGIFVMNDGDYYGDNVELMTQDLVDYLNEKLEEKYDKPIFIVSHSPMHYSTRTIAHDDGLYAKLYFDVLNEAAAKGLNIIFLFGHDHNNGWDDYLGGGAIFLAKGDNINICTGDENSFEVRTLNFTYMNAGYIGYYSVENEGCCDLLSMTIFEITEGAVAISRVSVDGVELLKAPGVRNEYKNETGYDPDTSTRESYYEMVLTKVASTKPIKDVIERDNSDAPKKDYYRKVTKVEDGGKYLIIVQRYDSEDYYVMTHDVTSRNDAESVSHTGFSLMSALGFEETYVISPRFAKHEWLFTASDDGWLIGDGSKYIRVGLNGEATLENKGDVLNVKKSGSQFSIGDGHSKLSDCLGGSLVEFSEENPATVFIYEYVD